MSEEILIHTLAVVGTTLYVVRAVGRGGRVHRGVAAVLGAGLALLALALVSSGLVYGILIQHPVLGAAGLIQLPSAAIICWQELRR